MEQIIFKSLISMALFLSFGILSSSSIAFEPLLAISALLEAEQTGEMAPNVSESCELSMSDAYEVQRGFVKEKLKWDRIAGFKAGLTTQAAQSSFAISRPIFGILLKSGDFSKNPVLSLKHFRQLMVEIELGFVTNQPIKKTVQSVEELKQYISRVVPVIELPDVAFKNPHFNAIDLVASNTAFAGYLVDLKPNWLKEDINSLSVTLFHDGIVVSQGQGEDALGDQWEALRWLVNQVLANGWTIGEGYLFITGALGEIIPASPGIYRAQFNNEASIQFTLTP